MVELKETLQERERYKNMIFSESIMLVKVSWMSYYQWQVGDTPFSSVSYLKEMKWLNVCADIDDNRKYADIDENGNFAVVNGYCYGSFQTQRHIPHIEKIEGAPKDKNCESVDDVLIIFCAPNPERKGKRETNVIGWYVNAKVYRNYRYGDDKRFDWSYNIFAESKNCVLLPESERKDNVVWFLPQVKGSEINFGESAYKFPKKSAPELQKVLKAMADYEGENWCGMKWKL